MDRSTWLQSLVHRRLVGVVHSSTGKIEQIKELCVWPTHFSVGVDRFSKETGESLSGGDWMRIEPASREDMRRLHARKLRAKILHRLDHLTDDQVYFIAEMLHLS